MGKTRTRRRRKVSAKASTRRRRRRNAPPGVRAVGVKSHSRKRSSKKRRARARRRRNPAAVAAPTKKRRRRRAKATGTKRRRRRAKAAGTPTKRRRRRRSKAVGTPTKRRRRRRSKARRNPSRRRRSRRGSTGKRRARRARRNPGGKRRGRGLRRRRNPGGKRRGRGLRRRRNPGAVGGIVGGFRARFKQLLQPQVWLPPALHGALGVAAANYGPTVLAQYTGQFGLRNFGFGGVVLSGVSTAIGAGLASAASGFLSKRSVLAGKALSGIGRNVMIGGMIWTAIRLIGELSPSLAAKLRLPSAASGSMNGLGMYGGHYPGQYPSNVNLPGMGMVTSPEELVAGESMARQVAEFHGMGRVGDWMEMSGMGQPVPFQDIRGGMGDWVEMTPTSELAMESFNPATEAF